MTIIRWVLGGVAVLLTAGWLVTLLLYVASGDERYGELGTRLRRWVYTIGLLWFNFEVWGRVIWTIVTWNRPGGAD